MRLNKKEGTILSITAATWGLFLIGSGLVMSAQVKPIIHTTYVLHMEERKIAQAQAKTNEIKLKDLEIENAMPLSVDVKDYLENATQLTDETIHSLRLDTSLVNINQAGTYQYVISYGKKKYIGTIVVKEKPMPKITLRDVEYKLGNVSFSNYAKDYILEVLTPEVYNTCSNPNFQQVDPLATGIYNYTITCNNTTYTGKITILPDDKNNITIEDDEEDDEDDDYDFDFDE